MEGCLCPSHDYGCCPDGVTVAQGPKLEGCSGCEASEHGCCEDGFTSASGPDFQGCGCAGSKFGCCPDGVKVTFNFFKLSLVFRICLSIFFYQCVFVCVCVCVNESM